MSLPHTTRTLRFSHKRLRISVLPVPPVPAMLKQLVRRVELEVSGSQGDAPPKQHRDGAVQSFFRDIATLWRHPVYVFTVLGSTVYTGELPQSSKLPFHASCSCINKVCTSHAHALPVLRVDPVTPPCSCKD